MKKLKKVCKWKLKKELWKFYVYMLQTNSKMEKIDPGLSTIIAITLDLTRRFESDFFWGFKFSFGFYLTTFWLYPNSKKVCKIKKITI